MTLPPTRSNLTSSCGGINTILASCFILYSGCPRSATLAVFYGGGFLPSRLPRTHRGRERAARGAAPFSLRPALSTEFAPRPGPRRAASCAILCTLLRPLPPASLLSTGDATASLRPRPSTDPPAPAAAVCSTAGISGDHVSPAEVRSVPADCLPRAC